MSTPRIPFLGKGTLLNSSPLVLVGLAVGGFLAAKYLPTLSPLLYMVGVVALAAALAVAAWLAVDRYLLSGVSTREEVVDRGNVAYALLLLGPALILAAAVLGVAVMGVTVLQ